MAEVTGTGEPEHHQEIEDDLSSQALDQTVLTQESMKPSKLKQHLESRHGELVGKTASGKVGQIATTSTRQSQVGIVTTSLIQAPSSKGGGEITIPNTESQVGIANPNVHQATLSEVVVARGDFENIGPHTSTRHFEARSYGNPMFNYHFDSATDEVHMGASAIGAPTVPIKDSATHFLVLPGGTSGLLNRTEDASIVGNAETTIGNCRSGIVISKSLHTLIPLEGEEVEVAGCFVTFPPEAFPTSTLVKLIAEINSSKWPQNFDGYTPTLYVYAKGLQRKLHVKLPTWRACDLSEKTVGTVLHGRDGQFQWEDTKVVVPFTSEPYFEFDWEDFSPIFIGSWFRQDPPKYRISGAIFVSDDAELTVVFYVDHRPSIISESMVFDAISKRMSLMQPPKHFKIGLNQFQAKVGENLECSVTCLAPKELHFAPSDPFTFTIDESLGRNSFIENHGVVVCNFLEERTIHLQCSLKRESGERIGNASAFACKWSTRKRKASTRQRKRSGRQSGDEVTVNIHGRKVKKLRDDNRSKITGQNIAYGGAQLHINQADSTVAVSSSHSRGETPEYESSSPSETDEED